MRIALVDDDRNDRSQLRTYISNYLGEEGADCEIEEFENALTFLSGYAYTFDLVVMDIDMPGLSGIEAARQLREKDPHVTLMFVTNMPQYALEGYAVEAVDYLLKPLSYPDFRLKMQKARRYIARNADLPLALSTSGGGIPLQRVRRPVCGIPAALSLLPHSGSYHQGPGKAQ